MKFFLIFIPIAVAYFMAKHYKKQGYNFWRTFAMSILMLAGLFFLVLKLLG